ncbi:MAG: CRISPR-associated protein Cas4 [Tyzzerella sp.]|nr:CRISPR-associated protein Cas4 [Tyzzerella sp.]
MEDRITGVMIYYYFVCQRKLWYFCHEINMEAQNDNVLLGKILDESSYQRDEKHINIDNVINIDFVRENKELHEIKKSKAVEEASIWQVKYYLYYLKQRGVDGLKGKIDYPLLKKTLIVELTDEDIEKLDQVINKIVEIKKQENTPQFLATKLCKNCAYHDLCLI